MHKAFPIVVGVRLFELTVHGKDLIEGGDAPFLGHNNSIRRSKHPLMEPDQPFMKSGGTPRKLGSRSALSVSMRDCKVCAP